MKSQFEWTVVGAGPGGIAAIGQLLDHGVPSDTILWIDPQFTVGDFYNKWSAVPSNTKVALFLKFLYCCSSFNFKAITQSHSLEITQQTPDQGCTLGLMSSALQAITEHLITKVKTSRATVSDLTRVASGWRLDTAEQSITSGNVILAVGSEPKSQTHPQLHSIPLETALNPDLLEKNLDTDQTIAVHGASHSAILALRNLLQLGVKQVINFYKKPLLYAVPMNGWILFDNTGLKGEAAIWARDNINTRCHTNLTRHLATTDNLERYLPQCQSTVDCIGFKRRLLPINGDTRLCQYDDKTGIIAPGLFGVGIAFPQLVTNPLNQCEYNVGLWKFISYLKTVMPIWLQYGP